MILDYFSFSISNLQKRKLRSWLTLLGIVISILIIFVLASLSIGLQESVKEQFREIGADKFFVQPKGFVGLVGGDSAAKLTLEDVKTIEKVQGVRKTGTMGVESAKIEFGDEIRFTRIVGLDVDSIDLFFESSGLEIIEGRKLRKSQKRKIVLGNSYVDNSFLQKGVSLGNQISINDEKFRVVGILSSAGNSEDDRQIYMEKEEFDEFFETEGRISIITVQIESESDLKDIANKVEKKLRFSRDVKEENQDFSILTPEEILQSFGNILDILTGFLLGIAGISLLVGGINVANTMYTSVLERTKEIGIMKSIGARNGSVLSLFVVEAGILGLFGGLIGLFLGILISKSVEIYVDKFLGFGLLEAAFPTYLVVGCLGFSFVVGIFSGIWPAMQAVKVKPVEALRYE